MFHVTERLLLRPTWPEDWEAVHAGVADEAITRNLARAPWPYTEDDARWWTAREQDPRWPGFSVIESRTGRLVGSIGIHADDDGQAEIGYWFARPAWGRGYATEAGRGMLAVARAIGFGRLTAGHFVDNPASGRVLRKLGFVPTGKPGRRFSLARRGEVDSVEFALDLDAPCAMPRAA